jgi:hypothetical protein
MLVAMCVVRVQQSGTIGTLAKRHCRKPQGRYQCRGEAPLHRNHSSKSARHESSCRAKLLPIGPVNSCSFLVLVISVNWKPVRALFPLAYVRVFSTAKYELVHTGRGILSAPPRLETPSKAGPSLSADANAAIVGGTGDKGTAQSARSRLKDVIMVDRTVAATGTAAAAAARIQEEMGRRKVTEVDRSSRSRRAREIMRVVWMARRNLQAHRGASAAAENGQGGVA